MHFSWMNCSMAESIEASNFSDCPLYHDEAVFCFLHSVVLGYKSAWRTKRKGISLFTGTPSWHYPLFPVVLCLLMSSYSLLTFLIPKPLSFQAVFVSKLVSDKQCQDVGQQGKPEMHRSVASIQGSTWRTHSAWRKLHRRCRGEWWALRNK